MYEYVSIYVSVDAACICVSSLRSWWRLAILTQYTLHTHIEMFWKMRNREIEIENAIIVFVVLPYISVVLTAQHIPPLTTSSYRPPAILHKCIALDSTSMHIRHVMQTALWLLARMKGWRRMSGNWMNADLLNTVVSNIIYEYVIYIKYVRAKAWCWIKIKFSLHHFSSFFFSSFV